MSTTPSGQPTGRYATGAARFAIIVGIFMILAWIWLIYSGDIPELETRPLDQWLHIGGEIVTAIVLIVAGFALERGLRWARGLYLLATGMLLIAIIHAIAWYGERGLVSVVIALGVLAVLAVFFALRAEE